MCTVLVGTGRATGVASLALLIHVRPVNSDYVRLTSTSPHVLHQCAARIVNGGHDGDPLLSPHQVPRGASRRTSRRPGVSWIMAIIHSVNRLWHSLFQSFRGGQSRRDRLAWLIDVLELDHSIQASHFGEYISETTVYTVAAISIYYI